MLVHLESECLIMNYKNLVENAILKDKMQKRINEGLSNIENDFDLYENEEGVKSTVIQFLCDSHYGTYIPKNVCEIFQIDKCKNTENEFYWSDFEEVENDITFAFNELFPLLDGYSLYTGYTENGDYCLFLQFVEE